MRRSAVPIRQRSSTVALIAACVVLGAASCGSDDGSSTAETAGEGADGPDSAVNETSADESGAATTEGAGNGPANATRTVRDVEGELQVPAEPRRVVFTDPSSFGNAMALGFPTDRIAGVAFGDARDSYGWMEERFGTDLSEFPEAPPIWNLNLEQVAALQPDLIIALSGWEEERADLAQIATVFTVHNGYETVDDYLTFLADVGVALDRSDEAAALTVGLEDRVAALKAKFAGDVPSVTMVRLPGADLYVSQVQPLFDELGLTRTTPPGSEFQEELSPELVTALDGDILWVSGSGLSPEEAREMAEANPVFASMDVVSSGGVRYIDDEPWGTEYSFPAVEWIFDEIEDGIDDWLSRR